jgi:hypothetical protein
VLQWLRCKLPVLQTWVLSATLTGDTTILAVVNKTSVEEGNTKQGVQRCLMSTDSIYVTKRVSACLLCVVF